jgi:hypothetical protein
MNTIEQSSSRDAKIEAAKNQASVQRSGSSSMAKNQSAGGSEIPNKVEDVGAEQMSGG